MSRARERFRDVLAGSTCVLAANIFDPLSDRRYAGVRGVCAVRFRWQGGEPGSSGYCAIQYVRCGRPLPAHTRMAAVSLMVDAEDGFGNAVNVRRTVQEMEAAGVSAIEIEDNVVPQKFNVRHPGLVSKEEQVGKLQAAVAARTNKTQVIVTGPAHWLHVR